MNDAIRKLSPRWEFALVTTLCFGYFVVSSVLILFRDVREVRLTTPRLVGGVAIELVMIGLTLWIVRVRGWSWDRLGLRFSWGAAAAGLPLFIWYMLLYWLTYIAVAMLYPSVRSLHPPRIVPAAPVAMMLLFILVNSLFEELAVTGYVVSALSEQGMAFSITASTLIRFAYHLYQGPIATIAILPLGLLFAGVFWRWRNLWPLMVAHTIANVLAMTGATS